MAVRNRVLEQPPNRPALSARYAYLNQVALAVGLVVEARRQHVEQPLPHLAVAEDVVMGGQVVFQRHRMLEAVEVERVRRVDVPYRLDGQLLLGELDELVPHRPLRHRHVGALVKLGGVLRLRQEHVELAALSEVLEVAQPVVVRAQLRLGLQTKPAPNRQVVHPRLRRRLELVLAHHLRRQLLRVGQRRVARALALALPFAFLLLLLRRLRCGCGRGCGRRGA